MKDFCHQTRFAHAGLMAELTARFSPHSIITDPKACRAYATRGMADAGDAPRAVILAESAADVQAAVQICHRHDVPVMPRGAGTNLTCAVSPSSDTVILCTSRMRRISDFDPVSGMVRVEAGVRNQAVSDHVADAGWSYAPDPSSRRNCTIGGNIATNSGGSSCLRSGVTVNHIAGLTVVESGGSLIELGGAAYDAPGLDLASLMCGAEGRMGIVVEAILRLTPIQPDSFALLIALDTPEQAQALSAEILASGIAPAQMDYMDRHSTALCKAFSHVGYPDARGGIILVDLLGPAARLAKAEATLSRIADVHGLACTAHHGAQKAAQVWQGRERIYGAAARVSRYVATDIAVPLSQITEMLAAVQACVDAAGLTHATVAHLGDGTVHSFVFHDDNCLTDAARAEQCATNIRKAAIRSGGTATSEYGIGARHLHLLSDQFTQTDLDVQTRCIKALRQPTPATRRRGQSATTARIYVPETEQDAARILSDGATGIFELTGRDRVAKAPDCSVLSAGALRGIVRHDPTDMTVTVRAGTPLADLSGHLRAHGQRLTFDVPEAPSDLTIGAAVARNLPTSRRPFGGSVRDALVATRCVTGLGEIIATGARVLKNVAGLDLGRVLAESSGDLAFLTEVTLRVIPLPAQEKTGVFPHVTAADFPAQVTRAMQAGWDITGAAHLSAQMARALGWTPVPSMVLRVDDCFEGHRLRGVNPPEVISHERALFFWDQMSSGGLFGVPKVASAAQIACKPTTGGAIAERLAQTSARIVMDWRGALIRVALDPSQNRETVREIVLAHSDADLRWSGEAPTEMQSNPLKPALDPLGRFKPAPSFSCFPN